MVLTYQQEMKMAQVMLDELGERLADRAGVGSVYADISPDQQCLLGVLGPQPDPDYHGPQPPNAIGVVVGVLPAANGKVTIRLAGGFDISYRQVPELDHMLAHLAYENDGHELRAKQPIAPSFQRHRVEFADVQLTLAVDDAGQWVDANDTLDVLLKQKAQQVRDDEQIFGRLRANDSGKPDYLLQWADCATQADLNALAQRQLFEHRDAVLPYAALVRARIRPAPVVFGQDGLWLLEVYLVNQTNNSDSRWFGVEQACLLDARFIVTVTEGVRVNVPHRLQPEDYRYRPQDNVPGYGVGCVVQEVDGTTVATDTFPIMPMQRTEAPSPEAVDMAQRPTYRGLASDPLPILHDFVTALARYQGDWLTTIGSLVDPEEIAVARRDAERFDEELARVREGVALLTAQPSLLRAFRLMNEAMANAIQLQGKSFDSWHLFQLGFILSQVRSLHERHHLPAAGGESAVADVLWFATGGGKTEAYLGIIVMGLIHARLHGRYSGCTAWMRFPLRMLSVQQFQRLSYVIAQAEMIRVREGIAGHPFTLGYFTGQGTPNRITQPDAERGQRDFLPLISDSQLEKYRLISDCPYCGTKNSIRIVKDLGKVRIRHECANDDCWSNAVAGAGLYGEGIRNEVGIYVSDEECYRYLPSVMVGTVDKLAVIGHNARFRLFFGGAKGFCPVHGFTRESKCEHFNVKRGPDGWDKEACKIHSRSSPDRVREVPALADPGFSLLIQDELHLMQESMGNFDSHYETLLNALQVAAGGQPPKILAATATIKEFENHVYHLYLREGRRFPAAGATNGESFYARRRYDPETGEPLIRRLFAGVMPVTGPTAAAASRSTAKIATRLLDLVDEWRGALKAGEPGLLGRLGLDTAAAPVALAHLERHLNTQLIYANSKRSIDEVLRFLEESAGANAASRPCQRIDGETPLDEILQAIRLIETKTADDPRRQFIATSVVSHGVDISELNMMIINGWPKSTAEYIQSSARSGRVHPGMVISVLSWQKLFEHNVFLNFNDYHFFIERLVESVPINRFAPNLLAKTMPAVVAGVIYNWAAGQKPWGSGIAYSALQVADALTKGGEEAQAALAAQIGKALAIPAAMLHRFDTRLVEGYNATLMAEAGRAVRRLLSWPGSKANATVPDAMEEIFGNRPMMSLRDIESQVLIKTQSSLDDQVIDAIA